MKRSAHSLPCLLKFNNNNSYDEVKHIVPDIGKKYTDKFSCIKTVHKQKKINLFTLYFIDIYQ